MPPISNDFLGGPLPFFHGTSMLFLDSIRKNGLGGRDLVKEWNVLEILRMVNNCGPDISAEVPSLAYNIESILQGKLEWQYGRCYVTSDLNRATLASSQPRGELIHQLYRLIEREKVILECIPDPQGLIRRFRSAIDILESQVKSPTEPVILKIRELNYDEVSLTDGSQVDNLTFGSYLYGVNLHVKSPIPWDRIQIMNPEDQKTTRSWLDERSDRWLV